MRSISLALVLVLSTLTLGAALCADELPNTPTALQKRLATYDPNAVAAARHYYLQPAMKAGMVAMVSNMNNAMMGIAAKQNPNLSPQQLDKIRHVISDVTNERLDLILQMSMVAALDTFSTDELVALDKFYSSPEGASILSKMPKLSSQLPAMLRTIMPDYMNEVKEKLKQNGAELKL